MVMDVGFVQGLFPKNARWAGRFLLVGKGRTRDGVIAMRSLPIFWGHAGNG